MNGFRVTGKHGVFEIGMAEGHRVTLREVGFERSFVLELDEAERIAECLIRQVQDIEDSDEDSGVDR